MGRNILVVEDDKNISDLIHMYLVKEGFDVRIAGDGGKALEEFQKKEPDLILLDIMLPVMDGWAVCAKIRETSKVPIIMLTAKSEVFDRIQGLEMGADDYIVKPFAPAELVARVESVLRRAGRSMVVYHLWDLTVDTAACRIQRGDEEIRLTPKEYELLLLFLRNRGRALYRDYLYETVWGEDDIADSTRTLDTHVTRLRRKLHLGDRLRTVRNVGYMLEKE